MTNMNAFARLRRALALLLGLTLSIGAAQAADTVTYYHTDALGTPVMESNSNGTVTYVREHKPFGEQALGASKNGPGFTGHVEDPDTGLTYMQARYYDSAASRFLSKDPVAVDLNAGGNFSRYWYANNNPNRYVDPDGRVPRGYHDLCNSPGGCEAGSFSDGGVSGSVRESEEKGSAYSPRKRGWHDYTEGPNLVCPADYACTPEEMKDYLSRFAVPGQDPSHPVKDGSINWVFDPRTGVPAGKVTTDISNNGLTIINTTLPGHVFHDGKIVRITSRSENGGWYSTTHGYGNNVLLGAATINQWQGPKIFRELDRQMRIYIEMQRQPR